VSILEDITILSDPSRFYVYDEMSMHPSWKSRTKCYATT